MQETRPDPMTLTGSITNPYTFTGREYDSETGLYYYRARYYDPKIGRFISEDPIGLAGGDINLYSYVGNNPVNWIDPLGLYTWPYTWKGWAGVTLGLAGVATAPVSPVAGVVLLGTGIGFTLWDVIEGPNEAIEDTNKKLEPARKEINELQKELNKQDKGCKK